jgi:sarcosine oxidase subunit alpha
MARLSSGGRIDRTDERRFTFNGRTLRGFAGDTLASALIANDIGLVARSFKYHRPRGLVAAGEEEPNALVQLGDGAWSEPNIKATRVELYDGLVARSVNCWPSAGFDLGALADLCHALLPAGFYYKTFMGAPGWPAWEALIRRAAGLGRAPEYADPDRYLKRNAHCDVLIVGGGPAGLAAARAAASSGARVILADDQPELGGCLLWQNASIDDGPALDWVAAVEQELARGEVTVLRRTMVSGYYDHNHLVAVERIADHLSPSQRDGLPRQRIWHIRAAQVVLATGAMERPLVFPDNDRPGIMLAAAARQYVNRFAALPGRRAVVFANNDSAWDAAADLQAAGVEIAALVDTRDGVDVAAAQRLTSVPRHAGSVIAAVRGQRRARAVRVAPAGTWIACDLVLMSGGWNPTVHLFSQSGGTLGWHDDAACFVPARPVQAVRSVGGSAGRFALAESLQDGHDAGMAAAPGGRATRPRAAPEPALQVRAFWQVASAQRRRQWVDFQNDVTNQDIGLAARENFASVEHLKRYTTAGMATDQGKTGNVNALALLGDLTGRAPADVGTTRFRPPFAPVTWSTIAAGATGDLYAVRRRLPADNAHRELDAVFEDLGGWERPDSYPRPGETGEQAARREHMAVRTGVGLLDSSPIGKVEVTGRDAAQFLDRIYARRVDDLAVGRIRYGLMLDENGVIIDDSVYARLAPQHFLLSPSSGAVGRIVAWLEEWRQCEYTDLDVHIADLTTAWAAVAVAGPRARDVLQRLAIDVDLSAASFPHMAIREGTIEGVPGRILRVSFSGELQYEVQVPSAYGDSFWRRLMEAGAGFGVTPIGVEAWLRLRLEKGYIHVGSDTDGTTTPDDVGFGALADRKPGDFAGRRSLSRPAMRRDDREQLVGLRLPSPKAVLPVGACLFVGKRFSAPMEKHGRVTSSCFSPTLGEPVALAMLKRGRSRIGERIGAWSDGHTWQAEVCSPVFYDPPGERLRG